VRTVDGKRVVQYNPLGSDALQALAFGEAATDSFTYTVKDEFGATSTATVAVRVAGQNNAPAAAAVSAATDEDTPLAITPAISDPDHGAVLSLVNMPVRSALGAALVVNPNGTIGYDPTAAVNLKRLAAGEHATDTFSYAVADQFGAAAHATVTVDVAGVTDTAMPNAGNGAEAKIGTLNVKLEANGSDVDAGSILSVGSFDAVGALGTTVTQNPDGKFKNGVSDAPDRPSDPQATLPANFGTESDEASSDPRPLFANDPALIMARDAIRRIADDAFALRHAIAQQDVDLAEALLLSGISISRYRNGNDAPRWRTRPKAAKILLFDGEKERFLSDALDDPFDCGDDTWTFVPRGQRTNFVACETEGVV
jgi:VCBS repeat-containing protein